MTATAKSPSHWEKPDSSKGTAATREQDLKPGKSDLKVGRDQDWIKAAKDQGAGFSGNATQVWRYSDNPAAVDYRNPPEHRFKLTDSGANTGEARTEIQNRLANQRKK
jgi:hypothetical protein